MTKQFITNVAVNDRSTSVEWDGLHEHVNRPHDTYDVDEVKIALKIEWEVTFDFREWGIKAMDVTVKKVTAYGSFKTIHREHDDDDKFHEFVLDTSLDPGYTFEAKVPPTKYGQLVPNYITIDLIGKSITVESV